MRKILAFLGIVGLGVAIFVYGMSFVDLTLDNMGNLPIILHLGIFLLLLPMMALEYPGIGQKDFYQTTFSMGRPWIYRTISVLGASFFIQFVIFHVASHAASPKIVNGDYVLSDHGTIVRTLNSVQYYWIKGCELRSFAAVWMLAYFVAATYWWFPRRERRALEL